MGGFGSAIALQSFSKSSTSGNDSFTGTLVVQPDRGFNVYVFCPRTFHRAFTPGPLSTYTFLILAHLISSISSFLVPSTNPLTVSFLPTAMKQSTTKPVTTPSPSPSLPTTTPPTYPFPTPNPRFNSRTSTPCSILNGKRRLRRGWTRWGSGLPGVVRGRRIRCCQSRARSTIA